MDNEKRRISLEEERAEMNRGGKLDYGNELKIDKPGIGATIMYEIRYFWQVQRDAVIGWGLLILLVFGVIGLWNHCDRSFMGMVHFFQNGFSRDGDFPAQTVPRGKEAGQKWEITHEGVDYVFRWCPTDTFRMGSPTSEKKRKDEETQHNVSLTGFWILETEVTHEMWDSVMHKRPAGESEKRLPVSEVSWEQAGRFCERLGRSSSWHFRLPTEAQWEYACRAESTGPYASDLKSVAWYEKTAKGEIHPVKKRRPNLWYIYDMHGNAAEWCRDRYDVDYYAESPKDNPLGPSYGRSRVVRGGSFESEAVDCRSAARTSSRQVKKAGFRFVLEYVPQSKKAKK